MPMSTTMASVLPTGSCSTRCPTVRGAGVGSGAAPMATPASASASPGMAGQSTPPAASPASINRGSCSGMSCEPVRTVWPRIKLGHAALVLRHAQRLQRRQVERLPIGSGDVDADDLQLIAVGFEERGQGLGDDHLAVRAGGRVEQHGAHGRRLGEGHRGDQQGEEQCGGGPAWTQRHRFLPCEEVHGECITPAARKPPNAA